jgi:hypothetical protein
MTSEHVLAWVGDDDEPRMEVARAELRGRDLVAGGMQVGDGYGLHYRLEPGTLTLEPLGGPAQVLPLGDADFFDLGLSPLFNSLPVLRDGLLQPGPARTYRMRWVDVPSLEVSWSEQVYEPLGGGVVGFRAGEFETRIEFDADGFVRAYPGLARRL